MRDRTSGMLKTSAIDETPPSSVVDDDPPPSRVLSAGEEIGSSSMRAAGGGERFGISLILTAIVPSLQRYWVRSPSGSSVPAACSRTACLRVSRTRFASLTLSRNLFIATHAIAMCEGATSTTASTVHFGHLLDIVPVAPTSVMRKRACDIGVGDVQMFSEIANFFKV